MSRKDWWLLSWEDLEQAVSTQDWQLAEDALRSLRDWYTISEIVVKMSKVLPLQQFHEFTDYFKHEIIKDALIFIKNNWFQDSANLLQSLKNCNVNWPELKAIERSLKSDNKLNETVNDMLQQLADALKKQNYQHAIRIGKLSKYHDVARPEVKQLFNDYKRALVKEVLMLIKENWYESARQFISDLHEADIDWPELKSISKSIELELNKGK